MDTTPGGHPGRVKLDGHDFIALARTPPAVLEKVFLKAPNQRRAA